MPIYYEDKYNTRQITVMSFSDIDKDIDFLHNLIEDENIIKKEIYFFDLDVLHARVVDMIAFFVFTKKVIVYVQKKYLRNYLIKLGINCFLIREKYIDSISKQDENIKGVDSITLEDVEPLLEEIFTRYGYDFRGYYKDSIHRRITNYLKTHRNFTLSDLTRSVIQKEENLNELLSGLIIGTTEFFRDGEVYRVLRSKILPYLNSFPSIKIWCAGCSTGEEAYSLAILLEEEGMLDKTFIYATDLSFNSIQLSKNAIYSFKEIKKASHNYIDSGGQSSLYNYFSDKGSYGEILDRYKDRILFFQHSLVNSGVINEFQLIFCRNVLMYFKNDLQSNTLKLFNDSLDRSGFLVIGKSEGIVNNTGVEYFKTYDSKNRIYRKIS